MVSGFERFGIVSSRSNWQWCSFQSVHHSSQSFETNSVQQKIKANAQGSSPDFKGWEPWTAPGSQESSWALGLHAVDARLKGLPLWRTKGQPKKKKLYLWIYFLNTLTGVPRDAGCHPERGQWKSRAWLKFTIASFSLKDIKKEAIMLHIVHAPWVESSATLMIFMCSY